MKKRIILFVPLVLFSVFIASCGFFGTDEEHLPAGMTTESGEYAQYSTCVEQCGRCEQNCLDRVYYDMAVIDVNNDVCGRIKSVTLQQTCIDELHTLKALTGNDPDLCKSLPDEGSQKNCLEHVYAEQAFVAGSPEACAVLDEPIGCEQLFYMDMAIKTGDESYCAMLENQIDCVEILATKSLESS